MTVDDQSHSRDGYTRKSLGAQSRNIKARIRRAIESLALDSYPDDVIFLGWDLELDYVSEPIFCVHLVVIGDPDLQPPAHVDLAETFAHDVVARVGDLNDQRRLEPKIIPSAIASPVDFVLPTTNVVFRRAEDDDPSQDDSAGKSPTEEGE